MFNTQRLTQMWDRITALEGLIHTAPVVSNIQPKPLEIQQQVEVAILPVVIEAKPEECCICMDAELGGNGTAKLNCGHEICLACFMNIMEARGMGTQNRCPLCRANFREATPPPVINGRVLREASPEPMPIDWAQFEDSEDESDEFAMNETQRRITTVIGSRPQPADRIHRRYNRNEWRNLALQTIRNHCNTLVRFGILRRVGRDYQLIR